MTVRMADRTTAPRLFARDPDAEWTALTTLAGTGLAPRPIRRFPDAVVTEYIEGITWDGQFMAAGKALRDLHAQTPPPLPLPVAPRCALQDGQKILQMCRDRSLGTVMPAAQPMTGPDVFLHGDPVGGNIVMQAGQARLIDWQCPARGPALHDIALFLSPAMQVIARGRAPSADEIAAFSAGYGPLPEDAITPLHWRIACHCQWRIEQGHEIYREALQAELTALAQSTRQQ